jgi:hypothetical protein
MQDRTSPTRRSLLATHGRTIHWVKSGKAQNEQMLSALPPKADRQQIRRHVRFVPCVDGSELARLFSRLQVGRCSHVFGLLVRFT